MQDPMDLAPEAAPSFSLQESLGILRRRRAIILQAFIIVFVAGLLITIFQPPVYRAGGKLLIEPQNYVINAVNSNDPLATLFMAASQYSIPTQIELLQSGDMRRRVAAKVGPNVPGFNVGAQEGTTIITISAEGDNPDNIANSINALMEEYVDKVADQSGQALDNALAYAKEHAQESAQEIKRYETRIQAFKRTHNTPDMDLSRTAAMAAVNDLTTAYNSALVDYQALEAQIGSTSQRLAAVKEHPLANPFESLGIDKNTQALLDPAVQGVQKQIDDLNLERNVLNSEAGDLGPGNLQIQLIDKKLDLLNKQRKGLVKSMNDRGSVLNPGIQKYEDDLAGLTIQASAKATQLNVLGQQLAAARKRLEMFPNVEFSYADMQDRLANARLNYQNLEKALDDLNLKKASTRKPASILERASVPSAPFKPNRGQYIVMAIAAGVFAGLCLAFLQELLDDRINSPEDAERALALPNLGYIPMIEEEGLRLIRDISTFSPLMESYRTLRTNINFAAVGGDVKSILVSSSVPAEGKSTTCANLAMAMALDGRRVVIVDADLRRPSQHKLFKTASSPGLTDILVGTHTIADVLQPTKVEGVSIIPAGSPPPNPAELLGSAAMGRFLGDIEAMADVILFDSPPTLAVADSVVLAARVDGVLLVIGFGETKKTNTRQAKNIMQRANAHILGTVLNRMIGPSSGYYYGKYYVPTIDTTSLPSASGGATSGVNGTNGSSLGESTNGSAAGDRPLALVSEAASSEAASDEYDMESGS